MKNKALFFGLLIIAALLVAGCQPETIVETVVVEKEGETIIETVEVEVEVEKEVEVVKEVEVAGGARGTSGTLTLLYWQAASTMNPYLSGGTKDIHASSMVLEPLARYDESANLVPWLAEEIPTIENGGVAEDLKSITWKLKEGLVWSDGTPVTSADVAFTGEYCLDPDMGCNALSGYADVESFEAIDELTIKVNFSVPKPFPYGPFVGAQNGAIVQKAQFEDCTGAKAQECTEENFYPIGTGPFVVTEFRANDTVLLEANELYRDPNKPFFQEVIFKGGGDAASAARAVLETGEADYAWNLQVEPEILRAMEAAGRGKILAGFGTGVERLMVNFTNDDPELGDNRSLWIDEDSDGVNDNPHPFLSDYNVRRALSLAIDRNVIVQVGYGFAGVPSCNVLAAPAIYASTANDECLAQNVEEANRLLDEAAGCPVPMVFARRMASV
jgi:peptide/nickel transport system substrate-binding protein